MGEFKPATRIREYLRQKEILVSGGSIDPEIIETVHADPLVEGAELRINDLYSLLALIEGYEGVIRQIPGDLDEDVQERTRSILYRVVGLVPEVADL